MSTGTRTWRVDYIPFESEVATTLDYIIDVRVTRAGKSTANTAEIVLSTIQGNGVSDGEVIYKPDDTIKIYAAEGDVDTANIDHLLGVFTIQDSEIQIDARTIKLTMIDRTYDILSKIWTGDVNDTVPNIIANIYQTVTNNTAALTTIDSTKSDGGAFSNVQYFAVTKTAYEVLNDLSQPKYTGDDRAYIFWVDENNRLYWTYPGQTPGALEFKNGTEPVIAMKTNKQESSVVSMIIYNAGEDKDGNDYVDFYLTPNANTIKGQMRYEEMQYISKDFRETALWTSSTNSEVQTELKERAEANCQRIVSQVGTGLQQASVATKGSKYAYGDLHWVSAPERGFPRTALRIERIVHTLNKNGWETSLNMAQDPDVIEI